MEVREKYLEIKNQGTKDKRWISKCGYQKQTLNDVNGYNEKVTYSPIPKIDIIIYNIVCLLIIFAYWGSNFCVSLSIFGSM